MGWSERVIRHLRLGAARWQEKRPQRGWGINTVNTVGMLVSYCSGSVKGESNPTTKRAPNPLTTALEVYC